MYFLALFTFLTFQAFPGNKDGNNIVTNRFDTPIIARYIRINPTRWRDRISMRLELYGCKYSKYSSKYIKPKFFLLFYTSDSSRPHIQNFQCLFFPFSVRESLNFRGNSMLIMDYRRVPIYSMHDHIRFRFRTTLPDGVLLYAKGSQGDYFALQLLHNRMLLNINLGKS